MKNMKNIEYKKSQAQPKKKEISLYKGKICLKKRNMLKIMEINLKG